jgi:hypothetical protein
MAIPFCRQQTPRSFEESEETIVQFNCPAYPKIKYWYTLLVRNVQQKRDRLEWPSVVQRVHDWRNSSLFASEISRLQLVKVVANAPTRIMRRGSLGKAPDRGIVLLLQRGSLWVCPAPTLAAAALAGGPCYAACSTSADHLPFRPSRDKELFADSLRPIRGDWFA